MSGQLAEWSEGSAVQESDWVNSIVQLATAGGFGSLVWYFLVKHIPAIEERHRAERMAILNDMREHHDRVEQLFEKYHETTKEHIKCMNECCQLLSRINERLRHHPQSDSD